MSDSKMSAGDAFGITASIGAALAIVIAIAMILIYPLYKSIAADGHIEYCYVETYSYSNPTAPNVVIYNLYGFRAWRGDRNIAQNLKSMDEVRDAAAKYGCNLK